MRRCLPGGLSGFIVLSPSWSRIEHEATMPFDGMCWGVTRRVLSETPRALACVDLALAQIGWGAKAARLLNQPAHFGAEYWAFC
jgi:hypothetical protein